MCAIISHAFRKHMQIAHVHSRDAVHFFFNSVKWSRNKNELWIKVQMLVLLTQNAISTKYRCISLFANAHA